MGWRSWNLYGANVNRGLIEGIMDGMVSKKRSVDGVPTSLCDLGYCDVGLDDNWQKCGAGVGGNNYHDADGNPIINEELFPVFDAPNCGTSGSVAQLAVATPDLSTLVAALSAASLVGVFNGTDIYS